MTNTTFTYAQLQQLWINNGGSTTTAPLAAAVAEAESGGRSWVTSSNPDGGTNVGPWQLDTPGGGGAGHTVAQLQDPNVNAAAAVKASNGGTNWTTWATYVSGAYKPFLSNSSTPDPNVPAGGSSSAAAPAALDAASSAACLIVVPTVDLKITSVGGGCLITKSEARAVIGAGLMGAGALIGLVALVILAASAFDHTGAGKVVAAVLPGPAGGAVRAASSAPRRKPPPAAPGSSSTPPAAPAPAAPAASRERGR